LTFPCGQGFTLNEALNGCSRIVPTPTSVDNCFLSALSDNAAGLTLDAVGVIPWLGPVTQVAVGILSTVNDAGHKDAFGALANIFSMQVTAYSNSLKEIGSAAPNFVPFVGWVLNYGAAARDIYSAYTDYEECASKNL